ncbi:MAG: hypothetical protein ABH873_04350 [Candidatus Firestonebacteria bacterium]
MKVQSLFYIDEDTKKKLEEIHSKYHKSLSEIAEESFSKTINEYLSGPKTFEEALTRAFGAAKDTKIENIREKFNKEMAERVKKIEGKFKKE